MTAPALSTAASQRLRKRHFEIGGEQRQLVAVRLEQHVRQDGNRVLALDDLLEELQFPHKIGFPGDQFHDEVVLGWTGPVGPLCTTQVEVKREDKKLYRKKVLLTKFAVPVTLNLSII